MENLHAVDDSVRFMMYAVEKSMTCGTESIVNQLYELHEHVLENLNVNDDAKCKAAYAIYQLAEAAAIELDLPKCPMCGTRVRPNPKFCQNCGELYKLPTTE